jgi:stalled ribosome alternative rescue factor ArfA
MKKYDQHKIKKAQVRHQQVSDGMFDGRFITRVEKSKKTYTRKNKHRNKSY